MNPVHTPSTALFKLIFVISGFRRAVLFEININPHSRNLGGGGGGNAPPIFFVSRNNFLLVTEVKRGK
jgi:hypothetical protein